MGKPILIYQDTLYHNGTGRALGEVKHLSSRRKRKKDANFLIC